MKTFFQQKLVKLFVLTALLFTSFSFKVFAGGDTYEIYINDKLICKQQYKLVSGSTDFSLSKVNENDKLVIKYSHCGEVGRNRSVVIKDEKGNIIKEWKFTDAQSNQSVMVIPVKELLALKEKNAALKLYYTAKQLPAGRLIASIKIDAKKTALTDPIKNNIILSSISK